MIDQTLEQEIIRFIKEEAIRIEFGKLLITLNVLNCKVTDGEAETKRHKKFCKNNA